MKNILIKILVICSLVSSVGMFNNNHPTYAITQSQQSLVDKFGNSKVYYTPTGKSFHLDRDCSRLSRSKNVYSDYLQNVISSHSDPCDVCVLGSVNSGNGQNNGNDLKVNMEELNKYLKIAYEQAFEREFDEEGLKYWISQFSEGKITLRSFLLNLIDTDEFNQKSKDSTDKIKRLYGVMLSRDADEGGLKYWESKLNENLTKYNNDRQAFLETVKEMIKADELKGIAQNLGVLY